MDIHRLLKMSSEERRIQTELAAARLRAHQHRDDAKEYLAVILLELRDVASKARLKTVVKHIDAARRELRVLPVSHVSRGKA